MGLLLLVSMTGFAASAQAHARIGHVGTALERNARALAARSTPASCPTGVPVQTITVVNDADVRFGVLKRVEHAVARQSLVLRRYWQTPCVRFGPAGWPLTIVTEMPSIPGEPAGIAGVHDYGPTGDIGTAGTWMIVETYGAPAEAWSEDLDHEVIEALVDPDVDRYVDETLVEVCDPVENRPGYQAANGVWLSDFVCPSWFMPGRRGPWDLLRLTHGPGDVSNGDPPS